MENTAIPPCEIRPYDHLWDMYYDEFEDENLGDTCTLKEVCEIADITAEDLINAYTPEIEC